MKGFLMLGLALWLVACSSHPPTDNESIKPGDSTLDSKHCPQLKDLNGLSIIGEVEYATINSVFTAPARIDTGAETTSIDARHIKKLDRDGQAWVAFEVHGRDKQVDKFKLPISRSVKIKRHGGESIERYVVQMTVKVGQRSAFIEVSLADRSSFEYAILIGRNFLQGQALVDVQGKFLTLDEAND